MSDTFALAYGGALIAFGLLGYFRGGSIISVLLGVICGAWTCYNATHPSRQNNVANLAIAAVLGAVFLLRALVGGKWFPGIVLIALSGAQVFRNYPYLK